MIKTEITKPTPKPIVNKNQISSLVSALHVPKTKITGPNHKKPTFVIEFMNYNFF